MTWVMCAWLHVLRRSTCPSQGMEATVQRAKCHTSPVSRSYTVPSSGTSTAGPSSPALGICQNHSMSAQGSPAVHALLCATSGRRSCGSRPGGALSMMFASIRGNLNAVELASEQYSSPPTLYSTMAVLSLRILGSVGLPSCAKQLVSHRGASSHGSLVQVAKLWESVWAP